MNATAAREDRGEPGGRVAEGMVHQARAARDRFEEGTHELTERLRQTTVPGYRHPINVGEAERLLSLAAGVPLAAAALVRRTTGGVLAGLAGTLLVYRGLTGHDPLYQALGMSTNDQPADRRTSVPYEQGVRVEETVTVARPREEVYHFWHNFENLPSFMTNLEMVTLYDDHRSHWVARAPVGTTVEWDAEIVNDIENERIGWRSLEGADVANAGSVQFRDLGDGQGTEVHVKMEYKPPAGPMGAAVATLLGDSPARQIREDLNRFKAVMEGERTPAWPSTPA
jgi:uncharacterized membrane protein